MSAATATRVALLRLLEEMQLDCAALEKHAEEIGEFRLRIDTATEKRPVLVVIAVDLHGYYTALESIFERVARVFDDTVPMGADSHRELLAQVAMEVPGVRPALVPAELRPWLHKLLGFRHFFRHAYAVELDAAELARHADALAAGHAALLAATTHFAEFIAQTADAISGN